MRSSQIQAEALKMLTDHYTKYSDGYCWINRNASMNMRYVYDLIRNHYYGIFTKPKDRYGEYKIPYPLTESATWENVKNIDIDTKDVNVRATRAANVRKSAAVRYAVKDWMCKVDFGEKINKWLMMYCLDGHLIVKKVKTKDGIDVKQIDLRNCFYDLQCESINDVPFMERSVQDWQDVISNNPDWINLSDLKGRYDVSRVSEESRGAEATTPEAEIFIYYGKIPYSWITGKNKDKEEWREGIIWASNLSDKGLVHKIMLNPEDKRPYEEVAFEDAPNRHPGRGVGEKLLFLQIYLNTLYNIRRNNNLVLMNQLFKYREGSGITPDKISRLVAGGAIGVSAMTDIERIDTQNINFTESLNEEQNLVSVANRVTSTQETATGDQLPSSTPATNAVLQAQAVKTSHQLRQERFGLFLARLFKNQIAPEMQSFYKKGKEIRIRKDDKFNELKEAKISAELERKYAGQNMLVGALEDKQKMEAEMDKSDDIFLNIDEDLKFSEYDVEFFVTDETFDKNTVLQNLQQILINYSKLPMDENSVKVLREIYDLMGLNANNLVPTQQTGMTMSGAAMPQQGGQGGEGQLLSTQVNKVNAQVGV